MASAYDALCTKYNNIASFTRPQEIAQAAVAKVTQEAEQSARKTAHEHLPEGVKVTISLAARQAMG